MSMRADAMTESIDRHMDQYMRKHTTLGRITTAVEHVADASEGRRSPTRQLVSQGVRAATRYVRRRRSR